MRAVLLLLLSLAVANASGASVPASPAEPHATLTAEPVRRAYVDLEEPLLPFSVRLTFTNHGPGDLHLPGSAPWFIVDERGDVVHYASGLLPVITLAPGETWHGRWDYATQCRTYGSALDGGCVVAAPPGTYTAHWEYLVDADPPHRSVSAEFEIRLVQD